MKQTSIVLLCISLIVILTSCSAAPQISKEEAGTAFAITTAVFMMSNYSFSVGQEVDNANYDAEKGVMSFNQLSFDQFKSNEPDGLKYTSMSGTMSKGLNNTVDADLTLEGGPIKSIKYNVSVQIFNGILPKKIELTINGKPMEITPADIK